MGYIIDPKLNTILLAHLGSQDFVNTWWTSQNIFFCLKTPLEVHETNPQIIVRYLEKVKAILKEVNE